jgi:hypothetical protein
MRITFILSIILLASCANISTDSKTIDFDSIKSDIKKVMDQQSVDWSEGNIDGFMEGYWKSDSLRFVGSRGITYGWDQTKANYKKGYPDKDAMGELKFDIHDIDVLSSEASLLLGSYTLFRTKDTLSGNFTLTWKKINDKWLITSDMTCG